MASNFNNAQNFQIDSLQFVKLNPTADPLSKLEGRIAAGAIHDSAERCDAPKCHPETRVAVQNDLYSWIVDGDRESECPRKMKWVTGPAGTGKTAVMGSLADRCAANGLLGATFFFASWSASVGRRRKTAFVTTIAHQLAQYQEDLKNAICTAMEKNPGVLEKNLSVQMEILVLTPLCEVVCRSEGPGLRGAIIIDGLDECEAEQYHDTTSASLRGKPARKNTQDQLEILQVLQAASLDPSFPFRVLIASRPERIFREFFDPENNPTSFAHKLDLNEDYNADADIALFLKAQFNQIRRRYHLHFSWPSPVAIQTLVENASGQFIYAATVIQFLVSGHREPPKALLEAILKMNSATRQTSLNPLEQLDTLYTHILKSSPDPPLSLRWIHTIDPIRTSLYIPDSLRVASNINLLLQTESESSEAEHVLGNLHSLIQIPRPSDQAKATYGFYHTSLLDFLKDPDRCKELYLEPTEINRFFWDRFVGACTRGCNTPLLYSESFLELLAGLPYVANLSFGSAQSGALPTLASADWWVSVAIGYREARCLWLLFQDVHNSCQWYLCKPACRIWSRSILRRLGLTAWIGVLRRRTSQIQWERFSLLADKAIEDIE